MVLYAGTTIRVWEGVVQRLKAQAHDVKMNSELPDFLSSIFNRAATAGHGKEDVGALVKVLRAPWAGWDYRRPSTGV